jgi:3-methyladenine DNA glycosylase Tag
MAVTPNMQLVREKSLVTSCSEKARNSCEISTGAFASYISEFESSHPSQAVAEKGFKIPAQDCVVKDSVHSGFHIFAPDFLRYASKYRSMISCSSGVVVISASS